MHTPPGFVVALLILVAGLAGTASADQSIVPAGAQPFGGELTYMADAARFTDCRTGRSHPVAFEGDWIAAERAYVAAATLLPCPPPLDTQEKALGATLARTRRWRVIGNTLELFDDKGAPTALFEAVYL